MGISQTKLKLKERQDHLKHKKSELDAILAETEKEEQAEEEEEFYQESMMSDGTVLILIFVLAVMGMLLIYSSI